MKQLDEKRHKGTKAQSSSVIPAKAGIQEEADTMLTTIMAQQAVIDAIVARYNAEVEEINRKYESRLGARRESLTITAQSLIQLMKQNKPILFDGTDVVNLPHGSLIHSVADKVSIPKTAIADCKAQGFQDVIKIVESLDRDAISKWPDAKLILIGAERKQKEEFSYDIQNKGLQPLVQKGGSHE